MKGGTSVFLDDRQAAGSSMSTGYSRGRIIAVRQFLTDIAEWGWPIAPAAP